METENKLRIPYLEFDKDLALKTLLLSDEKMLDVRIKILRKLNIPYFPELKPLGSWLKHASELNGYTYTKPINRDIADIIAIDADLQKFAFVLA